MIFEVHGDVASSIASPQSLQLKLATGLSEYVQAERLATSDSLEGIETNNNCASDCEIAVTTTPSKNWIFVNQGNLFIKIDTTPVRERQLLGGTLGDVVLRLQLRADAEAIDVTQLIFTEVGANASSFATNVDRIELYEVGETTAFAHATLAGCGTQTVPPNSMCANMENTQLIVEEGQNVTVLVRPRINADTQGARSGHQLELLIDANLGASARGLESSNNLNDNDGDSNAEGELFIGVDSPAANAPIKSKKNVIVLSKVVNITNANPDANGTAVPTGNSRGFGQFKFSTAAHQNSLNGLNRWTLSGVIVNVNATNVAMAANGFKFYNKADPTIKVTCKARNAAGAVLTGEVTGTLLVDCASIASIIDSEISSGSDATFVLEGNIINSRVNSSQNSVLQASILDFTSIGATGFGAGASHIHWLDKDTTATRFLWVEFPDTVVNSTSYQN